MTNSTKIDNKYYSFKYNSTAETNTESDKDIRLPWLSPDNSLDKKVHVHVRIPESYHKKLKYVVDNCRIERSYNLFINKILAEELDKILKEKGYTETEIKPLLEELIDL